jgi:hypothetical protein
MNCPAEWLAGLSNSLIGVIKSNGFQRGLIRLIPFGAWQITIENICGNIQSAQSGYGLSIFSLSLFHNGFIVVPHETMLKSLWRNGFTRLYFKAKSKR